MRKFCTIAMAFVLALCLTQCKKTELTNDTPTNENPTDSTTVASGETVFITLKVSQDNDSRLEVDPPHVYFEEGDKIYVANHGKYVGTMTYNIATELFSANIIASLVEDPDAPLQFYMLGNLTPTETLTAGETTSCTINISDQTSDQTSKMHLPVVSYAPSNENFNETTEFTAILRNQCALVKFDVIPTTLTSNIILSGVKNVVTVNFNPDNENEEERFTYSQSQGGGSITVGKREDGYWAILLPQEAISGIENNVSSEVSSSNNYSATVSLPTIQANAYLNTGITVDFTKNGTVPLYSIGISTNPNEGGSVSGSGDYLNGQSCTVTATPDEDYMFINWTENDETVSEDAEYTFTISAADRNLVANFGLKRTISVSANPTEGGTAYIGTVGTTSAICPQGTNCTVRATAEEGYTFLYWTENDVTVSENAGYTFEVTSN